MLVCKKMYLEAQINNQYICIKNNSAQFREGRTTTTSRLSLVCSYECNDPELETAYEQAPKNRFQSEYFTGKREKELHNVQFLEESTQNPMDSPFKN